MKAIGAATVAGIDPLSFARAESEIEVAYLWLVAEQAIEMQQFQRTDLANRIVAGIATLLGIKVRTSG